MNVFLTGATGYIGRSVAARMRKSGHDVTALVRPGSDHAYLSDIGVATVTGDLTDVSQMPDTIAAHDVLIHAALSTQNTAALDRQVISALISSRAADAHIVYTSGVWVLARHEDAVDEDTLPDPIPVSAWRVEHEQIVLDADNGSQPTAVIRPGCVYGGRQSLLRDWFSAATRRDAIPVIGAGLNRWATVHVEDLADLYLAIVERRASGIFHGTDDNEHVMREMALELARANGDESRVAHVEESAARAQFGPLVDGLLADQRVSSRRTREALGWQPRRSSFASCVADQMVEWERSLEPIEASAG